MKGKRFFSIALVLVSTISLMTGCGQSTKKTEDPLTVYLWDGNLVNEMAPYIRGLVPDKEIEFIVGNNNVDLYCYLQENGALPDIITTRRFSENDAKAIRPDLLDLSGYDVVSEYYQYATQYYKSEGGEIQWLPVCGIPETMIVNKTLLEKNNLEVPTNYSEFANVCQTLSDNGIKPYVSELAMDWAAHSLLQGAAVDQFASFDGITWRSAAEKTKGDISFDDTLWKQIFDEVDTFIKDTHLETQDTENDLTAVRTDFIAEKAAIFRGTPEVMESLKSQMDAELVRIPYFSQTSEDSWVYTYPSLNVALNKDLKADKEKLNTALKVLDGFISEDGQKIIAGGNGMISYSITAQSDLNDLEGLETQVANNEFYIRYASNNSFSASLEAVKGLISGQMDKSQAYEAFKTAMNKQYAEEKTIHFDKGYDLKFGKNGRPAASSILTTVREAQNAELAFAPYTHFTSPIFEGDCSEKQLGMMIAAQQITPVFKAELTGTEITALVKSYLDNTSGGLLISTKYDLPVASGMKITVVSGDNGFTLEEITVDGKTIDHAKKYSIILTNETVSTLNKVNPDAKVEQVEESTLQGEWKQAILSGTKPSEPEDYITIK